MMQPKSAFGLGFPPEPKPHQTPPPPPENAEQGRIKEKTNQKLVNMLLKNANDISNELYNLKAKSKEIQTKIQHDIDSINSNLDLKLLDELLKNKNSSINNLISALNKLWLELARATYVVTKLRQHSRVLPSKEAYNSHPKQTSEKLQASINALSEKTIQMKWASSEMKSLLAREKLLREEVAAALEKLDDKENIESLLQPPYSKSKNSTSEKKTWSLSELLSEMNEMATKISKESSNKVPTSTPKPATTEQQTPIFEAKPMHIDSETSKPQINDPLNNLTNNVEGVKTTSENNSYLSEPKNSSQPFVNILKYPTFQSKIPLNIQNETSEPPFKFQSPNIQREISKSPPTVEVKPTNIQGETNNLPPRLKFNAQNKQSESKLSPKFEFKPLNIQGVTSKLHPTIGVKPPNIQGETDNIPPKFEFNAHNKQSESKVPPKFEFKPPNIQGVTSKLPPTIGVKPPNIQGETDNLPPKFEFNAHNEQSESKLPPKFEFKPPNIQGVTSKLPPTIEVKPPNIQCETNNLPPRFEFNVQNEQSESKLPPKFEFKPLNIQGITSKLPPTIGVKPPNIQGETNNLPPRYEFNVQNEQSESKLPPKFEFKPLNIQGVTSKLSPTIGVKTSNIQGETNNLPTRFTFTPLNIQGVTNKPLPKFEFKPPIFQSETNKPQFEFKMGVSTKPTPKFEFKPLNIQSETTKLPPTIETPFPKCPTFMSPSVRRRLRVGPKNLRAATGTTRVKFKPPIGRDVVSKNGVLQDVSVEYQNICLMTKYEDKSQEELRLEDYIIGHRSGIFSDKKREPFIHAPCNLNAHHIGTTRKKYQPKVGAEEVSNSKATRLLYYQCITFMKEYEDKCLEELRLEDYCLRQQQRSNPFWAPNWFKAKQQYPGTTLAKFEAITFSELPEHAKKYSRYQCITSMEVYKDKSFEELRHEDYMSGRRGMSVPEEEISTSDDTPTQKSETSTQNSKTSAHNSNPIRTFRNVRSFFQKRVIPEKNPETTTLRSESPTQNHETPTKHCENPTQNREEPTQNRKTPTKNYENPTQNREEPSENRETTTQNGKTTTKSFRTAEEKFSEGCRAHRLGKSEDDVETYDGVLELSPGNPSYLLRKARALKSLKKYREALEDAQKAVATRPSLVEGHILVAELCLILGEIASGEQAVRRATELEPSSAEQEREAFASLRTKQEDAKQFMERQMYHSALSILNVCLTLYSPSCPKMKLMKAECLANMGKYHEAQDVAINVSLFGSFDVDSIYILGLCSYHQDNDDQAIKHFLKVLYHAPDHEKAIKMYKTTKARKNSKLIKQKKEAGNQAFNRGQWRKALDLYNEALAIDRNNKEENAKLHYNRATVFAKMHETRNAALACTSALELNENYIKALLRRAQCYTELGKFEEAMEDYEKLYHIDPSAENKRLLDQANKTLVAHRGAYYYYKVLGIDKSATESDIKKAYKKCALQHHPDRHAGAPTAVLRKQERKFKELKEAYDTLSDPSKRAYYNRNQRFIDDDDD